MAIHAGKHAAVDGILEASGIDMQTDRLTVDFMGQRGIAVAGQAFFRSRFRRLFTGRLLAGCQNASGG
jgi:hypothetical protein